MNIFSHVCIRAYEMPEYKCQTCQHVVHTDRHAYCLCGKSPLTQRHTIPELAEIVTRIITETDAFGEYYNALHSCDLNLLEMGIAQEIFAYYYFKSHSVQYGVHRYYSRLMDGSSPPFTTRADGVIEHTDGTYSIVVINAPSDRPDDIARGYLSVDVRYRDVIIFESVFDVHLCTENFPVGDAPRYILHGDLHGVNWNVIKACVSPGASLSILPPLLPWQERARRFVLGNDLTDYQFGRRQIIAACGAGKSICADSIVNCRHESGQYAYDAVLIVVPNLHLLGQWFENMASWHTDRRYCLVGSDVDSERAGSVPYTLTTDPEEIENIVGFGNVVCISTYQSLDKVMDSGIQFDVCVCDEAHKCCGYGDSNYTLPVKSDFCADNMIFMTATPKIFACDDDNTGHTIAYSMDDEDIFGARFTYSFRNAIRDGIISDYRIVVGCGDDSDSQSEDAGMDANQARFLCESAVKYNLPSVLVFSTTHKENQRIYDETLRLIRTGRYPALRGYEIICMPNMARSTDKSRAMDAISSGRRVIVFNVRVFTIGSDVPRLSSVMIVGDRKSAIDSVQTVSRCLRKFPGKEYGTVLIPCIIEDREDLRADGGYESLRRFMLSMSTVDDAITEEIVRVKAKNVAKSDMITFGGSERRVQALTDNFELQLFGSAGEVEQTPRGPTHKISMLCEYCKREEQLPPADAIYMGVKVGTLLNNLISSRNVYRSQRNAWFRELLKIAPITDKLRARIRKSPHADFLRNGDDDGSETGDGSASSELEAKFTMLREYCVANGRYPTSQYVCDGVQIGTFAYRLLREPNSYPEHRVAWFRELLQIPGVQQSVRRTLDRYHARSRAPGTPSNPANPDVQVDVLHQFCLDNGRLPLASSAEGRTLRNLLHKKYDTEFCKRSLTALMRIESVRDAIAGKMQRVEENLRTYGTPEKPTRTEDTLNTLVEYCTLHGKLPAGREVYKDKNIGQFLTCIIQKRTRDASIHEQRVRKLMSIAAIRDELTARIENYERNGGKKQLTTRERYEVYYNFCKDNGRLPPAVLSVNGVNVGIMTKRILSNVADANPERKRLIERLLNISNIRESVQARIDKYADPEVQRHRNIPKEERYSALVDYWRTHGKAPAIPKTIHAGINVGSFLYNLMQPSYDSAWRERLLGIPEIRDEVQALIDHYAHMKK